MAFDETVLSGMPVTGPNVLINEQSDPMQALEPFIRQIVAEEFAKFRKEVTAQVLRIIVNQSRLQGIRRT